MITILESFQYTVKLANTLSSHVNHLLAKPAPMKKLIAPKLTEDNFDFCLNVSLKIVPYPILCKYIKAMRCFISKSLKVVLITGERLSDFFSTWSPDDLAFLVPFMAFL